MTQSAKSNCNQTGQFARLCFVLATEASTLQEKRWKKDERSYLVGSNLAQTICKETLRKTCKLGNELNWLEQAHARSQRLEAKIKLEKVV